MPLGFFRICQNEVDRLFVGLDLSLARPVVRKLGKVAVPVKGLAVVGLQPLGFGHFGDFLREGVEDIPIGLALEQRFAGLAEGMNVAVTIGGVDIYLLVVARGGKHHVGVQRHGVHAVVDVHDQVEVLPERRLKDLVPFGLIQVVGTPNDEGPWFLAVLGP